MNIRLKNVFIFVFIYFLAFAVFSLHANAQNQSPEQPQAQPAQPEAQPEVSTNAEVPPGQPATSTQTQEKQPEPADAPSHAHDGQIKTYKRIFAVFETSMGTFKARLFHTQAPRTVENFIALAEGTKMWRDPKTKEYVKRPLYTNLKFHRVRKGFVIQSGDPYLDLPGINELGFVLDDEFRPELRHVKPGILSMVNRYPAKNTNGSQFFITLADLSGPNGLDGKNPVFGEVVEGMDVVFNIGSVPVNRRNDRPLKDVILKSVKIIKE